MGKIFYIMGKSSCGKDTIYKKLLSLDKCNLKRIVPYTTRPIRDKEQNGVDYYFIDDAKLEEYRGKGLIIELREYNTVHGIWKYLTVDDGNTDLEENDYITIGTPESYEKMVNYYGTKNIVPILITVDDGVRLERALKRERAQEKPKYAEMCRRFLADEQDFSKEILDRLGINNVFANDDLDECVGEIENFILSHR